MPWARHATGVAALLRGYRCLAVTGAARGYVCSPLYRNALYAGPAQPRSAGPASPCYFTAGLRKPAPPAPPPAIWPVRSISTLKRRVFKIKKHKKKKRKKRWSRLSMIPWRPPPEERKITYQMPYKMRRIVKERRRRNKGNRTVRGRRQR